MDISICIVVPHYMNSNAQRTNILFKYHKFHVKSDALFGYKLCDKFIVGLFVSMKVADATFIG